MFQYKIWPVVSTWGKIEDLIFMQDGAPQHFAIVVCEWLMKIFLLDGCVDMVPMIG